MASQYHNPPDENIPFRNLKKISSRKFIFPSIFQMDSDFGIGFLHATDRSGNPFPKGKIGTESGIALCMSVEFWVDCEAPTFPAKDCLGMA